MRSLRTFTIVVGVVALFILAGCGNDNKSSNRPLPTENAEANFDEKSAKEVEMQVYKEEREAAIAVKESVRKICAAKEIDRPAATSELDNNLDDLLYGFGLPSLSEEAVDQRQKQVKKWVGECKMSLRVYKAFAKEFDNEMGYKLP